MLVPPIRIALPLHKMVALLLIMDRLLHPMAPHQRLMVHLWPLMDLLQAEQVELLQEQVALQVAPTQEEALVLHRDPAVLVRPQCTCPPRSLSPPGSTLPSVWVTQQRLPSIVLIPRFRQARGLPMNRLPPVVRQLSHREPHQSINRVLRVALGESVRTVLLGVT